MGNGMNFPNFEQLEFKSHKQKYWLAPFLKAMKKLGETTADNPAPSV